MHPPIGASDSQHWHLGHRPRREASLPSPVRAAEMVKTNIQWRRRNLIQEREQEKRLTKKEAKINLNFKFILFEVSVGLSNI